MYNFKEFINIINENKIFQKYIENERYALGKALLSVGSLIKKKGSEQGGDNSINISTKDILRKIIMFVKYSMTVDIEDRILINILQIFVLLINKSENICQMQNHLDRLDATKTLLIIFSDDNRKEISGELLKNYLILLLALLNEGNN